MLKRHFLENEFKKALPLENTSSSIKSISFQIDTSSSQVHYMHSLKGIQIPKSGLRSKLKMIFSQISFHVVN